MPVGYLHVTCARDTVAESCGRIILILIQTAGKLCQLATGQSGSGVHAAVSTCGKLSLFLLARTHACNCTTLAVKTAREAWIPVKAEEWGIIHLHCSVSY